MKTTSLCYSSYLQQRSKNSMDEIRLGFKSKWNWILRKNDNFNDNVLNLKSGLNRPNIFE